MKNIGCWLIVSLLVVACNDGGPSIASGKRCSKSYNPIDMKVEKGRIDLEDDKAFAELLPGEYNFTGASVFYLDNITNTKLHYVVSKPEGQTEFKARTDCVRNYSVIDGLDKTITAVSQITIGESRHVSINTKTFRLAFAGTKRIFEFKDGEDKIDASPKEPYIEGDAEEFFMVAVKPNSIYNIQASYPVMVDVDGKPFQRGTLFISTNFKRSDLKPTPTYPHGH